MYWILTALAAVVGRMSLAATSALGWVLAVFVFDVVRLRRSLVLANLRIALPALSAVERVQVGRASIYHFILTALEFLRSARHDPLSGIQMVGVESMHAALSTGQGAFILCFHMGNWEAMGAACNHHIVPSYVLVKKVGSDSVDRFVSEVRRKIGFRWVPRRQKGDGYRAIKEALGRGDIIGFVMDQARPGEPKLPFFGRPAKTNTSLAAIWYRSPAAIVPAFARRTGVGQHVVEFLPPLDLAKTTDQAADILRLSAQFNAVVESCVRRCPEQYFWMHNRWK